MYKKLALIISIVIFCTNIITLLEQTCYGSVYKKEPTHVLKENHGKLDNALQNENTDTFSISKKAYNYEKSVEEKEEVIKKEFERIIIKKRYRFQKARSNTDDGKTNKCLLFEANNDTIQKGDFVVFL